MHEVYFISDTEEYVHLDWFLTLVFLFLFCRQQLAPKSPQTCNSI